ncbi:universal stress protein [Desulfobacula phenolica]|uniref:Nucleotide-binding universal stress protein, UspA family n=1 Tax=Desulfobacula phenolica TaxID=90732 RepID=A0A1H2DU65_9BACT|nr:universal stress protein [Desulfobacula phenolica]SDT86407.1 Nucleotide-binding universal stress protein, UspA family [Desulfobacula phenolica]
MFKKILFATSASAASDHAARVAFNIAKSYQSDLNIFHVLGVPSRGYSQFVVDVKTKERVDVDEDYIAWVNEEIKTYYGKYLDENLNYTIDVAVGWPAREILRQAKTLKPDLILIGGSTGDEDETVYKKSSAGTTLQKVAKAANCPVLVVNRPAASFWGGVSNIVFGTDFSKTSDKAFEFALKVAKTLDCELHVFHALDISPLNSGRMLSQDEIEQQIRESIRKIRALYGERLKELSNYSMDVWEGIPYMEIVKYARDKHADLLIMAHHSRKLPSEDIRLGGNVEQVIVRAGCPVISVNK